jgi:hypothetical protein
MTDTNLILFNQEFAKDISSQELISKIETKLLETLWMELAFFDKLNFFYIGHHADSRGSIFGPDFVEGDENIEQYFTYRDESYLKWVELEFDLEEDISEYDLFDEKLYVYCMKYGQENNYLELNNTFKPSELLNDSGMGCYEEYGCSGIDVTVIPNKEKINELLKSKNHTFGDLDEVSKLKIVESLIDTVSNPHTGPNGRDFEGISEHLLQLIKMHPKTSEELKVVIALSQN